MIKYWYEPWKSGPSVYVLSHHKILCLRRLERLTFLLLKIRTCAFLIIASLWLSASEVSHCSLHKHLGCYQSLALCCVLRTSRWITLITALEELTLPIRRSQDGEPCKHDYNGKVIQWMFLKSTGESWKMERLILEEGIGGSFQKEGAIKISFDGWVISQIDIEA